jgi:ESCRT-I complex subunit VPS37
MKYSSMASDETWESSGLLLGKAVNEVIKHLQLNPPTNITITDPQLKKIQATISRPPDAQHQRMPSHPPRQTSFDAPPDYETLLHAQPSTTDDMHIPMPTIPAQFSQIEAMGKSEIKALLDSEQSFREFAQTVMSGEALFDLRDEIKEGNLEMARANLEKEDDLKKLHASVASLRLDLKTSLEALNGLQERHKELCGPRDRRDLMRRLNQAKRQALDESEEIATEWVEGKSEKSVEEFLETFLERRTIHHMRASKLEKLQTEGF